MYALVQEVGLLDDGDWALDALVFDPTLGVTGDEKTTYRVRKGDIQ